MHCRASSHSYEIMAEFAPLFPVLSDPNSNSTFSFTPEFEGKLTFPFVSSNSVQCAVEHVLCSGTCMLTSLDRQNQN